MSAILRHQPITVGEHEQPTYARIESALDEGVLFSAEYGGECIALPETIGQLLRELVHHLANGDAVTVVSIDKELTTQEAADILNVSRPYLIRLLEAHAIPYSKIGTHRRLRLHDILAYKVQRDAETRQALAELTRMSEEMGLY